MRPKNGMREKPSEKFDNTIQTIKDITSTQNMINDARARRQINPFLRVIILKKRVFQISDKI